MQICTVVFPSVFLKNNLCFLNYLAYLCQYLRVAFLCSNLLESSESALHERYRKSSTRDLFSEFLPQEVGDLHSLSLIFWLDFSHISTLFSLRVEEYSVGIGPHSQYICGKACIVMRLAPLVSLTTMLLVRSLVSKALSACRTERHTHYQQQILFLICPPSPLTVFFLSLCSLFQCFFLHSHNFITLFV